ACIGAGGGGKKLAAPLGGTGEPAMETTAQIPGAGLSRIAMAPEPPVPGMAHHTVISELTEDGVNALVEVGGPESGSPLLQTELRHLCGALARPPQDGGALGKLGPELVSV